MTLGAYRINFDALLARLLFRWPIQSGLLLVICIALIGVTSGIVPPIWRGQATLVIEASPNGAVTVDGKPWPASLYAGPHQIRTTMPDGRTSWADITLRSGQTLTVTLPIGLQPVAQPLTAAAPGMYVKQVYYADGAWRIQSVPEVPSLSQDTTVTESPAFQGQTSQTIAIRPSGAERLATIDTYGGLADQMTLDGKLLEVVYQADTNTSFGRQAQGTVFQRGWTTSEVTIPISNPVTLLRFAPDGEGMLLGEQIGAGEQLSFIPARSTRPVPAVAVPGRTTRIDWQANGDAALITSVDGTRMTLTLLRVRPTLAAAVIAEQRVSSQNNVLVPTAWGLDSVYWIVQDVDGNGVLWRSPLTTLLPERQRPLSAVAIRILPDGSVRTATIVDEQLVIGREHGEQFIGEGVVPNLLATPDLIGRWEQEGLMMQGVEQSWLVTMDEE